MKIKVSSVSIGFEFLFLTGQQPGAGCILSQSAHSDVMKN